MKNRSAATFLKRIISVLCSITKAKSIAIRNKTNAVKARLVVISLLKNRKVSLGSISDKIQAILGHQDKKRGHGEGVDHEDDDQSKAIVLYNCNDDDDGKYPDLTHSLFEDEEDNDVEDVGDPNGSVIDLVRNSKGGDEAFRLEDDIDHVADLFIRKFHKLMRMQKLESFKRYQEMLQRSA